NPFDANESPDFCDATVEPRIAFVGRLVPEKGLDTVITALRQLPGVMLDIYGDGPARSSLEALAQSLNVRNQVVFHGRQANPISRGDMKRSIVWRTPVADQRLILGAGVTGLGAGIASQWPVYEASAVSGGICASYYIAPNSGQRLYAAPADGGAYRFEIGGGHW